MKAVSTYQGDQTGHRRIVAVVVLWMIIGTFVFAASSAYAYERYTVPKNLREGWHGDVQFGVLASFGPTNSSAVSGRSNFSFRRNGWEHEFDGRYHRSTSEALLIQRDANGVSLKDSSGEDVTTVIRTTTNDRRFFSAQSRRFFAKRYYLFGFADIDVNEPANLYRASRQIAGVGYKLWRNKSDIVSAAIGAGRKERVDVSGESEEGAIGYLGFRFKRAMSKKITLSADLDSDFGGENRYSEAETSMSIKLRDPISLKLKYEVRFNSSILDPINTFDDGVRSALSVNMAIDVF